jgi:hypothetical protein
MMEKDPYHKIDHIEVLCRCELQEPTTRALIMEKTIKIVGYKPRDDPFDPHWRVRPGKKRIIFDEIVRVAVFDTNFYQQVSLDDSSQHIDWVIPDKSRGLIRFLATRKGGIGTNDYRTCMIQAQKEVGEATIEANLWTKKDNKPEVVSTTIFVMSDQIKYQVEVIEAPYIGFSLSTPQLYLTTNIGYKVFKNSLDEPDKLTNVQVCAVLQNSFSAGFYMNGSGDSPILMNDGDMANLEFTLVDANYHPLKLLSPMYIFLKADATKDEARDISMWRGKLPLNHPSRMELMLEKAIQEGRAKGLGFYPMVPRIDLSQYPQIPIQVPLVDMSPEVAEAFLTSTGIL